MARISKKLSRGEKKLFLATGLAIVLILIFGAWRSYVDAIPDFKIPTPKIPSPNAYDFYVKAGAAIAKANPSVKAIYVGTDDRQSQWRTRYPTAKKEAWLRRNATALKILRQGFKYPCRATRSFDLKYPEARPNIWALARMMSVENHARSERGIWKGTIENTLDIFKLGHDVSQGGTDVDCHVGGIISGIGSRDLWEVLPHLNAPDTKTATRRLEKIIATRVSYADVLREDKSYLQISLWESMHSWCIDNPKLPWGERWQWFTTPRRVFFNNYTNYMNSWIARAEKPYHSNAPFPAPPDDFLNRPLS